MTLKINHTLINTEPIVYFACIAWGAEQEGIISILDMKVSGFTYFAKSYEYL